MSSLLTLSPLVGIVSKPDQMDVSSFFSRPLCAVLREVLGWSVPVFGVDSFRSGVPPGRKFVGSKLESLIERRKKLKPGSKTARNLTRLEVWYVSRVPTS